MGYALTDFSGKVTFVEEYLVLEYSELDRQASQLDIDYFELEKQLQQATSAQGKCVYFRRYTSWHWIIISDKLPIDWVMALVLA